MGSVYEAEHTGTGRRVAVKLINSGDIAKNDMLVSRFQREAKAAGAIDTQHITQVLDTGTDRESGLPFMVMEFLAGEDLQQTLKRLGPLAPDTALRIVAQACLGLQKAHDAQVVHRDIKPANLFLAQRDAGEVLIKLLDFGIAKVKMDHANETENAGLTRTGNMLGSPLYMSPEQARGTRQIDHRADIWSLGVVLYQTLSGRTPYAHIQALGELIIAICHEPPPPIQDVAPWVPPEVAAIVHGAVRQVPSERFQSAAAMLAAIRPLLPNGWAINEGMLIPLSDDVKTRVASRLELTSPVEGAATVMQAQTGDRSVSSPDIASRVSSPYVAGRASNPDATNTASAMVQSQGAQPRASSSKTPIAVGALVVVALCGGGIYALTKRQAHTQGTEIKAQNPPAPISAPAPMPAPSPAPTMSPATTTDALPAVAGSSRRVKLVIVPADASVEIEGVAAKSSNGIVEITGTPGSVHRVRLFKGKSETITDVIITEAGPAPPKVELRIGGAKPSTSAAASTAPATPAQPGIIDKFE